MFLKFCKLTGNNLCWSLFSAIWAWLEKRLWYSCFPVNIEKIYEHFFVGHLWAIPSESTAIHVTLFLLEHWCTVLSWTPYEVLVGSPEINGYFSLKYFLLDSL